MTLEQRKCKSNKESNNAIFQLIFYKGDSGTIKKRLTRSKDDFAVAFTTTQPVTYSWENIEIYLETSQGNCFKRSPPVQKRILDNGKCLTSVFK